MSGRRTYNWDGRDYPSVTSILGTVVAKPGLISWAAKVSAAAAVDEYDASGNVARSLAKGAAAPNAGRDAGGARGTDVHRVLHHLGLGMPLPSVSPPAKPYVASLCDWWDEAKPEAALAEATVVSKAHGYAGTLDAIWRMPDGRTLLADAKTSAYRSAEEGMQLAAYRYADVVAMPDGSEVALPDCDGAAILAVSPDGCELIDVDADEEAWIAFRAAVILATWLWAAGR